MFPRKPSEALIDPGESELLSTAMALHKEGNLDQAEVLYEVLLKRAPRNADVLQYLAMLNAQRGHTDKAVEYWQQALTMDPRHFAASINVGNFLSANGKFDSAIEHYHLAAEIKPDSFDAHIGLGTACRAIGRQDDAVASYRRALEIRPDFAELHANLGIILASLGRLDDAVASYRRALKIMPNFSEVHNNLGSVLRLLGQFDAAVASYRTALEVKPDFAEAHYNLGNILIVRRQFDEGLESYRQAVKINPDYMLAKQALDKFLQWNVAAFCGRDPGKAAPPVVRFIVATRESEDRFFENTALGKCLRNIPVEIKIFEKNQKGLPVLYNQAIRDAREHEAILVFIHDDVFLPGYFFVEEIASALERFEIVGVVGNKRRIPSQPSWALVDTNGTLDDRENLSGVCGSGKGSELYRIHDFGPTRQQVKLLDGLMIAVHSKTLISKSIEFDERFDFDFYDMDICRQAEVKNVSMGTWNISVIHESDGNYSDNWRASYKKYLEKWGA
jgi:tetratricopeptide (TPR) repeat protein